MLRAIHGNSSNVPTPKVEIGASMKPTRDALLNGATVLVALCTFVITGLTVYRQVSPQQARDSRASLPPSRVEDWESLVSTGHRIGPEKAAITVLVFADFECPACAAFATNVYPEFRDRYPGQTALVYRHWPLRQHRFAYPAARASECAAEQGHFAPFHDLVYVQQGELGLKSFHDFAVEASVPDISAFDACYARRETVPSIERDIRTVRQIGGTGTPTVIVNGWLFRDGVRLQRLDSIARHALGTMGKADTR
jgi:protein-disulfide isomerase